MGLLLRILVGLALIAAFIYGGLYALGNLVEPEPREIVVPVPMRKRCPPIRRLSHGFSPHPHFSRPCSRPERGAAQNTIASYERDLEDYTSALAVRKLDPLRRMSRSCEPICRGFSEAGLAPATIARRLSALRQFHGFLYTEGHRGDDPTVTLQGPRKTMRIPHVLTLEDVDRLLKTAEAGIAEAKTPAAAALAALRLAALVELLYATGLRVSELLALPAASINAKRDHLVVRGKGNKERIVLLTEAARNAVARYRAAWEEKKGREPSRFLFPADGEAGHLARQVFARALKRLAGRAGIAAESLTPAWHAPRFRDASAAEWCRICGSCSSFWAMRILRRRRSIPMFWMNVPAPWCAICIR